MDQAARGVAALADSDALTAVAAFTQALIQHPTSPDYFTKRSTAFTRLKPPRHDLALKDAEYAILLGQKRASREKIQAGQQRRVVALFNLGRYNDASFLLQTMLKWRIPNNRKDKMEGDIWKAKIEQRTRNIPEIDLAPLTVTEIPNFDLPDQSTLKASLQRQLKADGTFRFEGEDDNTTSSTKPVAEPATQQSISATPASTSMPSSISAAPAAPAKIRHEWYQNSQSVIVTIYAKGVPKDKAEIDIQDDSVSVSFPHPSNKETTFSFFLDPLFALIDSASSKFSIMSTKVELTLQKTAPGQKWPALEGTTPLISKEKSTDPIAKATVMSTITQAPPMKLAETAPSYPTSSRTGPKNWDKLASDLTAKSKSKTKSAKDKTAASKATSGSEPDDDEADVDSDFEGGDAVDGFFKKLYAGADPDTRRAMMKSFQESNGTALSTNWDEVGKGKVEEVKGRDD